MPPPGASEATTEPRATGPRGGAGGRLPRRWIIAAYVSATFVMTWPYVNYGHFATAGYEGDARLVTWILAWDNHAVIDGWPLFRANAFFPAPDSLRYNEHAFGLSLFTLPWTLAGASPTLAYNLTWWAAFVLNGLASFAYLRRVVTQDLAAFMGSLVFTFSFYVMLHAHGHLQLIWAWGLPASLLLAERWFDRPSAGRLAAWVVTLWLLVLTSWYLAVMVVTANAALALVLLATSSDVARGPTRPGTRQLWGWRGLHLAAAVLALGITVFPFARHYAGLNASRTEAAAGSATLASYWVPPANSLAGRWWLAHIDDRPGSIWGEQSLFLGWIALVLAGIGMAALLRRRDIPRRAWVFPLLALGGCLLSLGPDLGVLGGSTLAPFWWLSGLPGIGGIRAPARFAVLVTLGVGGLAAIGASALLRRRGPWTRVLVAAVPLMLCEWFVVDFPAGTPQPFAVPAIYRTPEVLAARSLVSLPDYRGTAESYRNSDYLYYSTAHWRPIVNGFGRGEPPGHADLIDIARRFPATAATLRALGVQYVVVHAGRYPDGAAAMLAAARAHPACRLVSRVDSDYLFAIAD